MVKLPWVLMSDKIFCLLVLGVVFGLLLELGFDCRFWWFSCAVVGVVVVKYLFFHLLMVLGCCCLRGFCLFVYWALSCLLRLLFAVRSSGWLVCGGCFSMLPVVVVGFLCYRFVCGICFGY